MIKHPRKQSLASGYPNNRDTQDTCAVQVDVAALVLSHANRLNLRIHSSRGDILVYPALAPFAPQRLERPLARLCYTHCVLPRAASSGPPNARKPRNVPQPTPRQRSTPPRASGAS